MAKADVHELLYGKYEENQKIYQKFREKKKQIKDFIEAHGSAPLQRSDEWFLMRNNVIGASELAALVGMSPYQNFDDLARKKRSKSNSSYSNSACWWGTVFEDVAVKYAESELSTKNKWYKHLRKTAGRHPTTWEARGKPRWMHMRNCGFCTGG